VPVNTTSNKKIYIASLVALALLLFGFITNNNLAIIAPLGIATALFALCSLDRLLLLIALTTPFSINLSELAGGFPFDMSLPTEPLLVLTMGIFFLRTLTERPNNTLYRHPISIAIYAYICWLLISTATSTMFVISLKQCISQLWFITSFYFVPAHIFERRHYVFKYFSCYAFSMSAIVLWVLFKHSESFFAHETSYTIMQPFFKDHTSYGAALAMLLPIMLVLQKENEKKTFTTISLWAIIAILSTGTLYSYTRAAWAGLIAAIGVYLVARFRIKATTVFISTATVATILLLSWNQIIISLEQNSKTSATDSFSQKVKSMTNIKNDDSNLERLNRWSCAYRMFLDKPVFGFGPGTYMFKYGAYQLSSEKTVISTNSASLGNAHSEYLGRLAEMGLIGMLLFIAVIGWTIYRALCIFSYNNDSYHQQMALFALLALLTYYLHGFLNNFLDMDKITALFWPLTALIASIDISSKKQALIK